MISSENELHIIPRGREQIFSFWQVARRLGIYTVIDARRVRVIEAFLAPDSPSLDSLREFAGVTTRERVRQLITTGLVKTRNSAPYELQEQYSQQDLSKLNRRPKVEPDPKDEIPKIANNWQSLNNAVREVTGKRLPTLDLLSKSLSEKGLKIRSKRRGNNTYYLIDPNEIGHLSLLYQDHPEVFRARTWKRANPWVERHRLEVVSKANKIIGRINEGKRIRWGTVSGEELDIILGKMADELKKPKSMLNRPDFDAPLVFLNGSNLRRLYTFARTHKERQNKPVMSFLSERAGIKVSVEDLIAHISSGRMVFWRRIPREVQLDLIDLSLRLPTVMNDWKRPLALLNGRSLLGLMWHLYHHSERAPGEGGTAFFRRYLGLPPVPIYTRVPLYTRGEFRKQQMHEFFKQQVIGESAEIMTLDGLMPWIQSVASLYQNPRFGISREDLEAEAFIVAKEFEITGSPGDFIERIHSRFEEILRGEVSVQYKEKSLDTPIRNIDNLTVGDFLVASSDTNVRYSQAFSEQMLESMDILSQAQQQLIYSVIVDERTFEEIGAEIGVDADQLRQDYKNILARLQEDLMWKFG